MSHAASFACAGAVDPEALRRPACCQAPLRLPGSKIVLCHTPLGSVKLHVHTYHCSTCDKTLVAKAAHIGCFPVVMSPPAGDAVWVDHRLLNEQTLLSAKGTTFTGALAACPWRW